MTAPRVGLPVRGSTTGRPVMVALDVLGRRGALRVLWELRDARLTFRALQEASDMNPASLNKRIKELRELEIIDLGVSRSDALCTCAKRPMAAVRCPQSRFFLAVSRRP